MSIVTHIKATKFYINNKAKKHLTLLFEADVSLQMRLKNYLMSIVAAQCEEDQPKGCYIVLCQAEAASGDMPEEAKNLLTQAGSYLQSLLTDIFHEDPEAQRLGLNNNAKRNALCLATTLRGTASMARIGEPLSELEYVVDHSLKGIGF